jgi:hypothetical protein
MSPKMFAMINVVAAQVIIFVIYYCTARARKFDKIAGGYYVVGLQLVLLPQLLVMHLDFVKLLTIALNVIGIAFLAKSLLGMVDSRPSDSR